MVSTKISFTTAALAVLGGLQTAGAHSWVETIFRIGADGGFTGEPGYPIGYIPRTDPNFSDDSQLTKFLTKEGNPAICKPTAGAYQGYKRLSAAPGDHVSMQYQENGHVTDPTLTPRPFRGGNVYVYGTLKHEDSDGINDILNVWTADGKGGNGKGQLLATHFYDDGVCYQNRGGAAAGAAFPIYLERQQKYGFDDVSCQTAFQLPENLPTSGKYTVMWVWDWPQHGPDGKVTVPEMYASCAEIDLRAPDSGSAAEVNFAKGGKINAQSAGIQSQLATPIEAATIAEGTMSPPPATMTAPPANGNGGAKPTAAPAASTTAAPSNGGNGNGAGNGNGNGDGDVAAPETVTVTAEPATQTLVQTVTVGNGNGNGNPAATQQPSQAVPTGPAVVTSVQPFLLKRARATGAARRRFLA